MMKPLHFPTRASWRVLCAAVIATLALLVAPSAATSAVPASTATPASTTTQMGQSPIDIRDRDLVRVSPLPKLQWHYPESRVEVTNTGAPSDEATIRATLLDGAGLSVAGKRYRLLQFHWHIASEHRRNGKPFAMELHLVHQSADGDLLVVGVWIKPGRANQDLAPVFDHLPAAGAANSATVALRTLLPRRMTSFRYEGSLTTPPFSEGVRWVVMSEPTTMSHAQITAFAAVFPEGNRRDVQASAGRTVVTDVGSCSARRHDHARCNPRQ